MRSLTTLALCVVCCSWYFWSNVVQAVPDLPKPSDVSWHLKGAEALLSGKTPYVEAAYDYPPLPSFLAIPLVNLDYVTSRWIWFTLSHLFLLMAAYLVWRFVGGGIPALWCVLLVWTFGGAVRENVALGQLGPLLVLLVAVSYTQPGMLGGFAAGFGLGLKFIPGVLGLPILMTRRWKPISGALLGGIMCLVLPWAAMYAVNGPKSPQVATYWMGTPAILSWSAPSAVLRVLDPAKKGPSLPVNWIRGNGTNNIHLAARERLISTLVGGGLLFTGATLVFVLTRRLPPAHLAFTMAGLISLALAASPISWTHYQLLQYPGLALLLYEAYRRRKWKVLAIVSLAGLAIYQIPVAVLTAYYNKYGGWTAESPATLYIWTNVTPVACLLLFGLHLCAARWSEAKIDA